MREIIFRGKRIDNGEWANGNYVEKIHYYEGSELPCIQVVMQKPSISDRFVPCFETELVEVDPETVGQYTGLKDRNGKMIFECDLIRFKWSIDGEEEGFHIGCIHWDDIRLGFSVTGNSFDTTEKGMLLYASLGDICDVTEVEIIGNIHEEEKK